MDILDNIESFSKLKSSIDSHYTKINDEVVKKSDFLKELETQKRIIEDTSQKHRQNYAESLQIAEDARKKIDECQKQFVDYLKEFETTKTHTEDARKKIDVYQQQLDEHRQLIDCVQKQLVDVETKFISHMEQYESNRKLTDERIEKLAKLFVSLSMAVNSISQ